MESAQKWGTTTCSSCTVKRWRVLNYKPKESKKIDTSKYPRNKRGDIIYPDGG
jgi:hypothetical protein